MKFIYCPLCGGHLTEKEMGDEGLIPFCAACNKPWFESVQSCVIAAVINEENEIALLKQDFQTDIFWALAAGYLKKDENAEQAIIREIQEETGLYTEKLEFAGSYAFPEREQIMLGFHARVKKQEFRKSPEILDIQWFSLEKAITTVPPDSIAQKILLTLV